MFTATKKECFNCDLSKNLYLSTPEMEEELNRLFAANNDIRVRSYRPCCRRKLILDEKPSLTNHPLSSTNYYGLNEIEEEFKKNGIDYEYCTYEDEKFISPEKSYNSKIQSGIFFRSQKKKRTKKSENFEYCVFCKNNEQPPEIYMNHCLRTSNNTVICPILRQYVCPICNATGDKAHTRKYCPLSGSSWSRRSPLDTSL